jgi:GT2 family glycosyltransferase
VLEYGNRLAADDPAVAFGRAVDFGPAACMLVDRAAFAARDGFSATFAPAYYEDADLCLGLAEAGLRTVYVPASRVLHARYGSGNPASASKLSEQRRRTFAAL